MYYKLETLLQSQIQSGIWMRFQFSISLFFKFNTCNFSIQICWKLFTVILGIWFIMCVNIFKNQFKCCTSKFQYQCTCLWLWNSSGERQEKVNAECPALKELLMVGLGYKDSRPHLLVSYDTWELVLSRTVGNVVNFNINLPAWNDYARILEQNMFSPTCFVLVSDSVRRKHM